MTVKCNPLRAAPGVSAHPRVLLAVAATVAGADLLTKAAAVALSRWMPIGLPGGWSLRVAHNHGVVLGIGAGTIAPHVAAILAVVEIAWLVFVGRRRAGRVGLLWAVAVGLILGAALGNLGEHQLFGSVVDWIRPPQPNVVFDLADVAAAVGQVLVLALGGAPPGSQQEPRAGGHDPRKGVPRMRPFILLTQAAVAVLGLLALALGSVPFFVLAVAACAALGAGGVRIERRRPDYQRIEYLERLNGLPPSRRGR